MTRRRGRQRKRSENASRHKRKQSNRKMDWPLAKLQLEKNLVILEGISEPCVLIAGPGKSSGDKPNCPPVRSSLSMIRPSPHLSWGASNDGVIVNEPYHRHSQSFIERHPNIQPKMRSILLDWLIEVSEAYTLHRQTFYLAQDYFDRFMLTQNNIGKEILQLVGITCLFIASKMEENCPPKVSQMSYVTAGTYYEEEILQMELIILKELQWNLCPETMVSWMNLYFQIASMNPKSDLLEPQFPQDTYLLVTRLLDLCVLSINCLDFEQRVLVASVLCHFVPQEKVEDISGLSKDVLQPCLNWMAPLVEAAARAGKVTVREFNSIKKEDRLNIQTHADYMAMLDYASQKVLNGQLPTPPNSTEKPH